MHKGFLKIAAVLGLIAVALGAFGAHGLKNVVSAQAVATFETGVRYQFYHVFALIAVALLYKEFPAVKTAGWLFITGKQPGGCLLPALFCLVALCMLWHWCRVWCSRGLNGLAPLRRLAGYFLL